MARRIRLELKTFIICNCHGGASTSPFKKLKTADFEFGGVLIADAPAAARPFIIMIKSDENVLMIITNKQNTAICMLAHTAKTAAAANALIVLMEA